MGPLVYTVVKENDKYFLQPFVDSFKIPKKTYGGLDKLMYRFWTSFVVSKTSIGAMFTGPSGTGKTTLAEMISNLGLINGFIVVLIKDINADIELVNFIENLDRAIVLMDEFAKNFGNLQDKMLTMFNDLSGKKKFFIITENDSNSINMYIRNRPGRIRYHVDFKRIKKNVIEEFCEDMRVNKLSEFYISLIKKHEKALVFSFDHLQALVTEHLRYPEDTFEDLLEVLNLEILSKEEQLNVISITDISDKDDPKLIEIDNPDIRMERKRFENGANMWLYPKDRSSSICVKPEDVISIDENIYKLLVNNKYEIILELS